MSSQSVLQTGNVTAGHLVSWATDGVVQDAGVAFSNSFGLLLVTTSAINFNVTNTDTPISIALPVGFTRYRVEKIIISGASASISTATCGVFTAAAAAGVAVVASGSAITVTQSNNNTNNNMQSLTIANQNTLALSSTTLFFRVQAAQGSAATANVSIFYEPLP